MTTRSQSTPMKYNPVTGTSNPFPSNASQFRMQYPRMIWNYNPWTGDMRDPYVLSKDPHGMDIKLNVEVN